MSVNFNHYGYSLPHLEQFGLISENTKKNKLQAIHKQICEDAQRHLKVLHNLLVIATANLLKKMKLCIKK